MTELRIGRIESGPGGVQGGMKRALLLAALLLGACGDEPGPRAAPEPSPAVDREYTCGGGTFTTEALEEREAPSDELLDAVEELRKGPEGGFLPADGWFVGSGDEDRALLLAPDGKLFDSATFERDEGKWVPAGWGDCTPRLYVPDKSVLRWKLAEESHPPEPDARELDVLVTEVECSSGRDIEGLIEADVTYGPDAIEVVLTAPALGRGAHTCQGTNPTPYDLVLEEPVGDREVVDLSVYPPTEPGPGTRIP